MDDLFVKEVDCAVHVTLDGVTLNDLAASLEVLEQCQQILDAILGIAAGIMPATPGAVTAYQLQLALANAGLWDTAHDGLPDTRTSERIQWDTGAGTVVNDLLSANIQTSLGFTEPQMEALYADARLLPPPVIFGNGVPGPQGPQGPQGPPGTEGAPGSVGQYQFQQALSNAGLWDTAHDGLPDTKTPARIQWDTGARTIFGDALSLNVQTSTNLNNTQMNNIYIAAQAIPVPGT